MINTIKVLDHGYVTLRNLAGPVRRPLEGEDIGNGGYVEGIERPFDADDTDPANAARFSFDGADEEGRSRDDDLKLDNYLLKNGHTTPFEMIEVWLEMKMPIFVARQFVRHRTVSINEVSARYTQLPNEFYIPELENIGPQSKDNKQGTADGGMTDTQKLMVQENMRDVCGLAYQKYQSMLHMGTSKEISRMILPLNIYTKWLWNQDLWNMMHMMKLRLHSHAQYEARCYAKAIYKLLKSELPELIKLFDEHVRIE